MNITQRIMAIASFFFEPGEPVPAAKIQAAKARIAASVDVRELAPPSYASIKAAANTARQQLELALQRQEGGEAGLERTVDAKLKQVLALNQKLEPRDRAY